MSVNRRIRVRVKNTHTPIIRRFTAQGPKGGAISVTQNEMVTDGSSGHIERCDDWNASDWSYPSTRGFTPGRWTDQGNKFDKSDVRVFPNVPETLHRIWNGGTYYYEWKHSGGFWLSHEHANAARLLHKGQFPGLPAEYVEWSDAQLKSMGATAISRVRPNDPGVAVATSLGELAHGLPSMIGTQMIRKPTVAHAGSEWLNYQFGILPTLGDIDNFATAMKDQDKILAQWYRDSGRKIRRRYSFPEEVEVLSDSSVTSSLPGVHSNLHQAGTLRRTVKVKRQVWFSGAFMYHAPGQDDWNKAIRDLDRVYGVIPDLETAWNLTGWSWLVDWKTNTGDVIGNINALAVDRLVLLYGYLMARSSCVVEYTWTGKVYRGGSNSLTPACYSAQVVYDRKRRLRADPFGIGFTGETLDGRQLSILAALGVSARGR